MSKSRTLSGLVSDGGALADGAISAADIGAQPTLVSGTNIKTINGTTLLGSGDLPIDVGVISFNTRTGAVVLGSGDVTGALGFTPYNASNPSGYTTNTGTVTSVGGTGTVSGLTLTGTVTGSGSLTLGGTLAVAASNFASQTANTVLAAPSGTAGVPTFRALVSADLPTYTGTITSAQITTGLGFTPYNSTNPSGYITGSGSITGNAATATTLQTTRTINGTNFNGSANINSTEWYHSDRDYPNGTLITTSIDYSGFAGDAFILLIEGNSYGNIIPMSIQYQGYIYSDTIINHGGYSVGYNLTGLVALNVGGNLCFWFPSQGYWNGYNVKVYSAFGTRAVNKVVSISGTTKPSGTKEVAFSTNIRQVLHSGNYTSYSPGLAGTGASGTWSINITGNAVTAGGLAVHTGRNNGANQIVRTDVNGYIQAGWINTDSGDSGLTGLGRVYASQDGYVRYYSPTNFRTVLNRAVFNRESNGGTMVAGNIYSIYTGGGAVGMYLPTAANTAQGDRIVIYNLLNQWSASNPFYVYMNTNTRLMGLNETMTCSINVGSIVLVCAYNDGTAYWTVSPGA